MAGAAAVVVLCAVYQSLALSKTPFPTDRPPPRELTHTAEWRAWRAEVHRKLSVEPITERAVADALRVRPPALPERPTGHKEADLLRRDQAVADVLLSYDGVRKILAARFGIGDDFLGTGLSKPLGRVPYAQASVHEYLIDNHADTHDHVWVWKLDAAGRDISQPIRSFLADERARTPPQNYGLKPTSRFEDDLKEIALRVKNPDHPIPPMIRFARFDQKFYKGTVGRPDASHAFTSNLSEVWDLTIQQAAEKSGYNYRDGDTLFIWVFVPYHSNEFTPATWRHVLERLPEWLEAKSR